MSQPSPEGTARQYDWDVFIAHADANTLEAERLYDLLSPQSRVFLDTRSLLPGDDWDRALQTAQRASRVTVVLVSWQTEGAYYQREEIAGAIALAREDAGAHRVVPVYLGDQVGNVPYGLRLKHGLDAGALGGLEPVADELRRLVALLRDGRDPRLAAGASAAEAAAASTSGIYLVRIINPPGPDTKPDVTTVWLSARGRETYIADSVTIEHLKGNLYGRIPVTGVQPLDAEYAFAYGEGQTATHALNPALVLAPDGRREVSFNIRLEPEGSFGAAGGQVEVRLHYHTLDGETGSLALVNPPKAVQMLARMLDAEVAVPRGLERYVVTARGLQRGVGATERGSFPTYGRLWTSRPYLLRTLARGEEPRRTDIGDTYRASVNQMLEAKGLSSEVAALIRAGDELGLELARGWTHVDVTAALREMVATGPKPDAALDALFARHTFSPGPELATVLLDPVVSRRVAQLFRGQRYPDGTSYGKSSEAADFLAAFPAGSWARAIVTLAREMGQEHHDLFDFVNARRDRIEEADRESVDAFCRDHVGATDAPRPSVLEYLAWREPHARAAT